MITFEVDSFSLVLLGFLQGLMVTSFLLIVVDSFFKGRER
tara:strand:+ start:2745 stop:2864 length:120 start_codon:yes stop_codon:yes gene_type:complete